MLQSCGLPSLPGLGCAPSQRPAWDPLATPGSWLLSSFRSRCPLLPTASSECFYRQKPWTRIRLVSWSSSDWSGLFAEVARIQAKRAGMKRECLNSCNWEVQGVSLSALRHNWIPGFKQSSRPVLSNTVTHGNLNRN